MLRVEVDGVSVPFEVHRFEATEAVFESFRAVVTISFFGDVPTASFTRAKARVEIPDGDATRVFGGVVSEVSRRIGVDTRGEIRHIVDLVLRPAHFALTFGRDTRIFQEMTAIQIIQDVLARGGLGAKKVAVASAIPTREYCVQYDESDWDFVARLAEDEGIAWLSHHDDAGETLVFREFPADDVPIDAPVLRPFRIREGAISSTSAVIEVHACERMGAGAIATAGYDFEKPALAVEDDAKAKLDDDREIYEHVLGPRASTAAIRLEEARNLAISIRGRSTVASFAPGRTFELGDHPVADLNRAYTLLRVEHRWEPTGTAEAGANTGYENTFLAIPSDATVRPPRLTRKPKVPGALTATVTGPSGEEIHTDAHGRIKVQFHWDRLGKKDDKSTCWLRVAQPWAGQAFGAWFLPRVGHEVVVSFLEGDPDRPICTGSVYTGANVPPYPLPADKTKSTIKSQTSPGGSGFNELRFEDKSGAEEIFLHAQRDWNTVVERRRTTRVVENDDLEIGDDRTQKVGGLEQVTIGKSSTKRIGDTLGLNVGSTATVEVAAAASVAVGAVASVAVGGALSQSVGGVYDLNVGGAQVSIVVGNRSDTIGGNADETIKGASTVKIEKDASTTIKEDLVFKVGKTTTAELTGKLTGKTGDDVVLELGDGTKLTVKKDGTVTLECKKLTIKSDGDVNIEGSKLKAEVSGSGQVKAGGTLEVKGSTVKIN